MASRPHQRYSIARPNNAARSSGTPTPSIANTQKPNSLPSLPATKAGSQRLKVVVRRLPPGLTQKEFAAVLGDEWKVGGSQVDWAQFKPGKLSRDPSKSSRPGRAYLHLTKEDHLTALANHVRDSAFVDEKGSLNDAALLGPPSVDFAPYGRIPAGRIRHDARQGTIDQDPEFIEFLESLTNPVTKAPPPETVTSSPEAGKAEFAVTPLIQFLRDKKANKGKEPASPAKSAKQGRNETKESKGSQSSEKKQNAKAETPAQPEKRSAAALKVEKAAREAVRVLNKQVEKQVAASPKSVPSGPALTASTSPSSPVPPPQPQPQPQPSQAANERRRERGSASAAARMLQRDLGLGAPAGRRRREAAQASSVESPKSTSSPNETDAPTIKPPTAPAALINPPMPSQASSSTAIPTGPSSRSSSSTNVSNQPRPQSKPVVAQASRAQQHLPKQQQHAPVQSTPQPPQRSAPQPSVSPSSTQAFLKHANPSQGITETLLSVAFTSFGSVFKVEIDKKKGFAYIDFEDNDALRKAIAASPVKVAEGQVVVLERKTGGALQQRNVRGGGSANTGRGAPSLPNPQPIPARSGGPPNSPRVSIPGGSTTRGRGPRGGRTMGRGGGGQAPGGGSLPGKQPVANASAPSTPADSTTGANIAGEANPTGS